MSTYRVPGPCEVKFNNLSLGTSKSGIILRARTDWTPITDDEHGTVPADFIFTGKACQVELGALDVVSLKAANLWHTYGGFLGSGGAAGMPATIGALASALSYALTITERDGISIWGALAAVPTSPDAATLASTSELNLPVTFLIIPDVNMKLFSTLPSYIYTP